MKGVYGSTCQLQQHGAAQGDRTGCVETKSRDSSGLSRRGNTRASDPASVHGQGAVAMGNSSKEIPMVLHLDHGVPFELCGLWQQFSLSHDRRIIAAIGEYPADEADDQIHPFPEGLRDRRASLGLAGIED